MCCILFCLLCIYGIRIFVRLIYHVWNLKPRNKIGILKLQICVTPKLCSCKIKKCSLSVCLFPRNLIFLCNGNKIRALTVGIFQRRLKFSPAKAAGTCEYCVLDWLSYKKSSDYTTFTRLEHPYNLFCLCDIMLCHEK